MEIKIRPITGDVILPSTELSDTAWKSKSEMEYEAEIQASAKRCLALLRASLLQHEIIRDKEGVEKIKRRIAQYEAIVNSTDSKR